jgi:probable HAF family extracellular repeat protein
MKEKPRVKTRIITLNVLSFALAASREPTANKRKATPMKQRNWMQRNIVLTIVHTLLILFASALVPALDTQAASFTGLGDLPGGSFDSGATAVSADGSVVVGRSSVDFCCYEAFRWTSAGGMVGLGQLDGGGFGFNSFATAVSADGSVVVGFGTPASGTEEAFRWTSAGGMVGLGDLAGGPTNSRANGVSANGSVVVGYGQTALGFQAFRWTSAGGMVSLGDLAGGPTNSQAFAVSADGSVVVGFGKPSASAVEAFRWTSAGGMVGLGDLFSGTIESQAFAVSADGSVVVGYGTAPQKEAFRWTSAGGMVDLEDVPSAIPESQALGVSANGSVVVGYADFSPDFVVNLEAFIWDAAHGMRNLKSVLTNDHGLDLTGWTLTAANGVSSNGLVIVGIGRNPDGQLEAWRAELDPLTNCPTITVSPATLPDGTVGIAYSQTITASGGTAPRTFAVTTGSRPGGLNLANAGTLSGTPTNAGVSGFTITATDANNCIGQRDYTLTINPTNLPPTAVGDAFEAAENTTLIVTAPGVLLNDSDPEGTPLQAFVVGVPTHTAGFGLNADGSFVYTPATNFSGLDAFAYQASDGTNDSNLATVFVSIGADTPAGTNVTVGFSAGTNTVSLTFSNVTTAGSTTVTPIDPTQAGTVPGGYTLFGGLAYEISSTATATPPIEVCFTVPSVSDTNIFAMLRVLHNEGGTLVDRTILPPDAPAPDFATRTLCARVSSLSPFVVAIFEPPPHDLAVTKLKAPKKVTLQEGTTPKPGKFSVSIQNLGPATEVISNATVLAQFLQLQIASRGGCASPVPTLVPPKNGFPVILAPKKKATFAYTATIDCANDSAAGAGHEDYETTVTLDHTTLDGLSDTTPSNDTCPRAASGVDKGCNKGVEALTDVFSKP